jgi:hypothetical protein
MTTGGSGVAGVQARASAADAADMNTDALRSAKLAVNSAAQRHALLYACERVRDSEEHAYGESSSDRGADPRASERHIAEAAALEAELELGCSTVPVGLGIAGRVGASLAELIETEMRERVHHGDIAPSGAQIRRAAGLMWTLVALDAEVEREIMPATPCAPESTPVSAQATGL